MRLGNLSCARTRWPDGQNCPSIVRLKSVCVGIRFLGNRVTAVHFFVMEGIQIKGASERETKGSGYGCSCVWTLTLLFHHWEVSTRRKVHFHLCINCSWAHLKCIVKFSRNILLQYCTCKHWLIVNNGCRKNKSNRYAETWADKWTLKRLQIKYNFNEIYSPNVFN